MSWRLPSRLCRSSSSRLPQPRQLHLLSRRPSSSETSAAGSSKPGGSAKLLRQQQQQQLLLVAQTVMRLLGLGNQPMPYGASHCTGLVQLRLLGNLTAMKPPSLGRQLTPRGDGSSAGPVAALLTGAKVALHSRQRVATPETQMRWGAPQTMQGCRSGAQKLLQRDPTEARADLAPRIWVPLAGGLGSDIWQALAPLGSSRLPLLRSVEWLPGPGLQAGAAPGTWLPLHAAASQQCLPGVSALPLPGQGLWAGACSGRSRLVLLEPPSRQQHAATRPLLVPGLNLRAGPRGQQPPRF